MSQKTPPVWKPRGATTAPSTDWNFDFTRGLKRTRAGETTSIRSDPPSRTGRTGQNSTTWRYTGTTTSAFGLSFRKVSPKARAGSSSPWTTVMVRRLPVRVLK